MMKLFLTLLVLLPLTGWAAVGDITGVEISPSGWSGRAWISGLNTNGSIVTGFTGSNNLGTPRWTFRVNRNGYNADGTTNIKADILYAVATLRHPWSNSAAGGPPGPFTNQIATIGNDSVVSFALSDVIASPDSIILDALAGAYTVTNGTGTNSIAITGLAVTNSSTQIYPKTMAWNKTIPWQIIQSSSYLSEVVAAQYFGENSFPVRSAHFWAVDANGNRSPTNIVTHWNVNWDGPIPMGVMSSWVDISGLTANTNFTNYVKVFPIVGNAATIVDASDGTEIVDSPYLGPVPLWNDRLLTMARVFVLVDRTNGVAAGVAVTNWTQALNGTAVPFTNFQTALNAAALTNMIFNGGTSRSNWHGVVCLVTNGIHGWISDPDTPTVTTRSEGFSWLEISNHPAALMANVIIRTNRGNQNIQRLLKPKFEGITFDMNGNASIVSSGHRAVCWIRCDIKTNEAGTASTLATFNTNNWLVLSTVGRIRGGFRMTSAGGGAGTPTEQRWYVWQNRFTSYLDTMRPCLFAGNLVLPATNSPTAIANDVVIVSVDPWMLYNNAILRADASSVTVSFGLGTNLNRGAFLANNIVEVSTNGNQPPFDFMQSAKPGEVCTNAIFWNDTVLCVTHPPFNHTTNQHTFTTWYSQQNNLFDDWEVGLDGALSTNQDPFRTNRWTHLYNPGSAGNVFCELNNVRGDSESISVTSGNWGFNGMFTSYYAVSNTGPTIGYMSHRALISSTAGLGNGDYKLRSDSPVFIHNRNPRHPMPFSIDGKPIGATAPPGAFRDGDIRMAGAFF